MMSLKEETSDRREDEKAYRNIDGRWTCGHTGKD
jgi:hypothetical protein